MVKGSKLVKKLRAVAGGQVKDSHEILEVLTEGRRELARRKADEYEFRKDVLGAEVAIFGPVFGTPKSFEAIGDGATGRA